MIKEKEVKTKGSKFDPKKHITQIKGKDYLEVKWRLVWFREAHPDWSIQTNIDVDYDKKRATAKAMILNASGNLLATAHKMEDSSGFGDYLEKAETGAIGRALALCGFGTQFSPDIEEGTERLVDAPADHKSVTKVIAESPKPKYINTVEEATEAVEVVGFCKEHMKQMDKVSKTGKAYHTDYIDGEAKTCFGHGYWTPKEGK